MRFLTKLNPGTWREIFIFAAKFKPYGKQLKFQPPADVGETQGKR